MTERHRGNQHLDEPCHQHGAACSIAHRSERRRGAWAEHRDGDEINEVERDQRQSGNDGTREQVADCDRQRSEDALRKLRGLVGVAHLIAEQDQHCCWRKYLRQCGGRRHGPGRKARIVAVTQHGREHDQPDGDCGGADHPFGGRQQGANQQHRDAQPAGKRTEQPSHGLQQLLGDARAFQHDPHEDEQRYGEQNLVGHYAEHALWERAQEREIEDACTLPDGRESKRDAAQRQRHRIAGKQHRADRNHHQHGDDLGCAHHPVPAGASPASSLASSRPARSACEIPCSPISTANNGMSVLSR